MYMCNSAAKIMLYWSLLCVKQCEQLAGYHGRNSYVWYMQLPFSAEVAGGSCCIHIGVYTFGILFKVHKQEI